MAADNPEKRQSAMRLGQVGRGPALPTGTDDAATRAANLGLYAMGGDAPAEAPSVYVPFKKVMRFLEVLRAYRRGRSFEYAVRRGLVPTRANQNGAASGWQNSDVDVTSIPGVPPLKASGRRIGDP